MVALMVDKEMLQFVFNTLYFLKEAEYSASLICVFQFNFRKQ